MHSRTRCRAWHLPLTLLLASSLLSVAGSSADAIVGGAPAPPGRWPWMAAVLHAGVRDAAAAQFCGGVVIAPRRVLTTGHCVIDEPAEEIDVLVGRTRLTQRDGRRIAVKAVSVYPGYANGRARSLDASVLTLAADAQVPALALAQPGQDAMWAPGTPAWTAGWGQLNARKSRGGLNYYADRLRELQEPLQGDDACEGVYGLGLPGIPYRPEWLLCSGLPGDRAGTCYGDSGAPLVVAGPDGWLDVGIDIASDSCASPEYFDLKVRVDRISGFALQDAPTARPEPMTMPHITGRLAKGSRVRCSTGRWRGEHARISVRWVRLGAMDRTVGRHRSYRLRARDAAAGVRCAVTARNRGGYLTVRARALRPRAG